MEKKFPTLILHNYHFMLNTILLRNKGFHSYYIESFGIFFYIRVKHWEEDNESNALWSRGNRRSYGSHSEIEDFIVVIVSKLHSECGHFSVFSFHNQEEKSWHKLHFLVGFSFYWDFPKILCSLIGGVLLSCLLF